jgi:hypothetical protein
MPASYLEWLADVFEEAQIPYTPETAPYLDVCVRKLVDGASVSEEEVFRRIRERWLRHGPSGRQLLAAFLRDDVFSRRDSPMRPREGEAYYTNAYQPRTVFPNPQR